MPAAGRPVSRLALGLTGGLALLLAGCAEMPVAGPTTRQVIYPDPKEGADYYVVPLTPAVVSTLESYRPPTLADAFGDGRPAPTQAIGVGDALAITIWEAGENGLFTASAPPAPGMAPATGARSITLPNQIVDQRGTVTVPYLGQVKVVGRSPLDVQRAIVAGLKERAVEPQAIVTVAQNASNAVTVTGDVNHPGTVPLQVNGTQLLQAIAGAGGTPVPAYDTVVQLTRSGISRRARLQSIVQDPRQNVYLQPGDLVYLARDPRTVVVLGSTTKNAQVPFETKKLTLAEAVGKAGGLLDERADPTGLFVFRYEPAEVVHALIPESRNRQLPPLVPVVFRADMQRPQSYFNTQSFAMRDKDVVYVATSEVVQLSKLVALLRNASLIFSAHNVPVD